MEKGFYFTLINKEWFVVTDRTVKTDKFARDILSEALNVAGIEGDVSANYVKYFRKYNLVPATLEIHHIKTSDEEFDYYSINGKNFGNYGGRVDDGSTIVIRMDR